MELRGKALKQLEQQALQILHAPARLPCAQPLDECFLRFRFWRFESFGPWCSWSVFNLWPPSADSGLILRHVTWDRLHDLSRLQEPILGLKQGFHTDPRIRHRDRVLRDSSVSERLKALRVIALPMAPQDMNFGTDGTTFGFEQEWPKMRLEWWCQGPAEWRLFTAWANDMITWLQEEPGPNS